jgi:predicted GIY-YIG superfamily endonuclease
LDEKAGPFWVYILEDPDERFYIGHTDNLHRRLAEHNDRLRSKTKCTAKHGPWRLVWSEEHPTRSAAMQRERFIKSRKSSAWIRKYLLGRASPDPDARPTRSVPHAKSNGPNTLTLC